MQASLPLYHVHCHKVQDLTQQSLFLNAMLKLSSPDFTSYATLVSKNMTGVERGIISRLIVTFYSHVLPAWQGRLQFRDRSLQTPDPLYNRQISLLEDLGQKSHQALIIFQREISCSNTTNSVISLLHERLGEMVLLHTNLGASINDRKNTESYLSDNLMLEASDPRCLDLVIHNKRMESLRYFLYVQGLIHILHCEMQTTYLHCQTQTLNLRYVMAYYDNITKLAPLQPELGDRILAAMTEHLPQAFQIPFEVLVERICNQACLTADEMCQFTIAVAKTYYKRGPNEFVMGLESFRSNPFASTHCVIRSRLLVMLSSVVVEKRCREWMVNHRNIACWNVLLSVSLLENLTKLKISVFSEEFKEDVFTSTEVKLYGEIPLAVIRLSTKYVSQFNQIFTNEELWKFNSELCGENCLEPLKWVYNFLQESQRSESMITIDEENKVVKGPPDVTTVERVRVKQETLVEKPPSGKISLEMSRALLKTYLLKATLNIDKPVLSEDPDVVIDSLLSEKSTTMQAS